MLQISISSLEPLTLNVFMQAVNFILQNRRAQDISKFMFFQDGQVGDSGIMDSEASQLRRLSSRTGGILETFATISEESSADQKEKASLDLPLVEQTPDSSTSSSSLTKEYDTIHTVQFLHTTAKEFIQAQQHKLLLGSADSVLTSLGGYDFLFLCCASSESWKRAIFKHMFYYLKMAELHDANDARNSSRFSILEKICALSPRVDDFNWLLSKYKTTFCDLLVQELEHEKFSNIYTLLILAVAANAKKLVKHVLDIWTQTIRPPTLEMERICLLQVAAVGPDLVPIEHQDRTGMIGILVSSGYPIDQMAYLWIDHERGERGRQTPFQVVLASEIESAYSEDARLDIVKCLLDQGSHVNNIFKFPDGYYNTPLAYCVRNESAALVRLLLEYNANASRPVVYRLCPMDYALVRQDKAILKALIDHGCDKLRPKALPSVDAVKELAVKQTMLMGSIGHPLLAVVSAQDPENIELTLSGFSI